MKEITLTLYGTSGCHLCEEALIEINNAINLLEAEVLVTLAEVDIVDDDSLYALYQTKIPVLRLETRGKERIVCWPFDHRVITMEMTSIGQ